VAISHSAAELILVSPDSRGRGSQDLAGLILSLVAEA